VRGITPTTLSNHLVLRPVERLERHTEEVTAVVAERGSIWSVGRDALVVQWDERSQRPADEIKGAARDTGSS
jgi:hypothetical protein